MDILLIHNNYNFELHLDSSKTVSVIVWGWEYCPLCSKPLRWATGDIERCTGCKFELHIMQRTLTEDFSCEASSPDEVFLAMPCAHGKMGTGCRACEDYEGCEYTARD